MKKVLIFIALVAAGVLVAVGVHLDSRNEFLSEMALSQIEALASGEGELEGSLDCYLGYRTCTWCGNYILVCIAPDQDRCQQIEAYPNYDESQAKCKFN